MTTAPSAKYRLANVEAGYAEVIQTLNSGREVTIGVVSEHKAGSTRTGTMWSASRPGSKRSKDFYTRDEAVKAIINRSI